jgi:L-lactate dehydrogenase complex protein LldE
MRVSLFIPCLVDQFFPQTGAAMVKVLRKLGVMVDYPSEQTCCGQPAFNTGYHREAIQLAERFIKIFSNAEYIVAPSGSCVSMVKVFYPELDLSPSFKEQSHAIAAKTFEFSEFLVNVLHVSDVGARFPAKATYHDACHLLRELKIKTEPRQLLRNVKGLELVEMEHSETCCGFGGTFSVKFPEISTAMAEEKIDAIHRAGVNYVVANDSSCLMQIAGLLARKKSPVKTIHLAEVLGNELNQ